MKIKELLEQRRKMKKKKPSFVRQDSHKRKKLAKNWRKPKGLHSKIRQGMGGHAKRVKIGFGLPRLVRNLNKDGLVIKRVSSLNELETVNPKTEGIIIAAEVGAKKKIEIIKKALEVKIKILNIKKPEGFEKMVQERIQKKREKKKEEKEKKKEEKPVKRKKSIEEEISEEEKKEREKREKDKILITKEA